MNAWHGGERVGKQRVPKEDRYYHCRFTKAHLNVIIYPGTEEFLRKYLDKWQIDITNTSQFSYSFLGQIGITSKEKIGGNDLASVSGQLYLTRRNICRCSFCQKGIYPPKSLPKSQKFDCILSLIRIVITESQGIVVLHKCCYDRWKLMHEISDNEEMKLEIPTNDLELVKIG